MGTFWLKVKYRQCTETPKGLMCHFLLVLYLSTINKNKISWLSNISLFFWIFLKWYFLAYWEAGSCTTICIYEINYYNMLFSFLKRERESFSLFVRSEALLQPGSNVVRRSWPIAWKFQERLMSFFDRLWPIIYLHYCKFDFPN